MNSKVEHDHIEMPVMLSHTYEDATQVDDNVAAHISKVEHDEHDGKKVEPEIQHSDNVETLVQLEGSLDKKRAAKLSRVTLQTFWENPKNRDSQNVELDLSKSLTSQLDRISPRLRGYNIKVALIGEETDILTEEPLEDQGIEELARLTIVAYYPTFERVEEEIRKTNGDLHERDNHIYAKVMTTKLPFNFADLEIKSPKSLRIESDTLETVSGVVDLLSLESLDLSECESLVSLPDSIGQLTSLTELDLDRCENLISLPDSIGDLTSLTELYLYKCTSLVSLPERFGQCESLTKLDLCNCTSLLSLPDSIGDLTSLTELNLYGCTSLVSLPERIGHCKSLTELNLQSCNKLASRFEQLPSVARLHLPTGLADKEATYVILSRISALTSLCLSYTEIQSLPDSIGDLTSLTTLNLYGCTSLVSLPERIGDLTSLTKLILGGCKSLQSLPERFGQCKSLASLDLHGCPAGESMPAALKRQLEAQGCKRGGYHGGGW